MEKKKKKKIGSSAEMMDNISFIDKEVEDDFVEEATRMLVKDFNIPEEDAKNMALLADKLHKSDL